MSEIQKQTGTVVIKTKYGAKEYETVASRIRKFRDADRKSVV